jgi:hypothetical protein
LEVSKVANTKGATIYGPYRSGDTLLVRTVTMHHIGALDSVQDGLLVFSEGGWLADSRRWAETLDTGKVSEFEREPTKFCVERGAVIDVRIWKHEIPQTQ